MSTIVSTQGLYLTTRNQPSSVQSLNGNSSSTSDSAADDSASSIASPLKESKSRQAIFAAATDNIDARDIGTDSTINVYISTGSTVNVYV